MFLWKIFEWVWYTIFISLRTENLNWMVEIAVSVQHWTVRRSFSMSLSSVFLLVPLSLIKYCWYWGDQGNDEPCIEECYFSSQTPWNHCEKPHHHVALVFDTSPSESSDRSVSQPSDPASPRAKKELSRAFLHQWVSKSRVHDPRNNKRPKDFTLHRALKQGFEYALTNIPWRKEALLSLIKSLQNYIYHYNIMYVDVCGQTGNYRAQLAHWDGLKSRRILDVSVHLWCSRTETQTFCLWIVHQNSHCLNWNSRQPSSSGLPGTYSSAPLSMSCADALISLIHSYALNLILTVHTTITSCLSPSAPINSGVKTSWNVVSGTGIFST